MTNQDAAWLAGFFEGEGSVRMGCRYQGKSGRAYGSILLDICQVNAEPLHKARSITGLGKVYGPYKYASNRQPHFKWCVMGTEKVKEIYEQLKPHLSAKRLAQFETAFEQRRKLNDRPRLKTGPKPKETSQCAS